MTTKEAEGCILSLWSCFVTGPMYLVLFYLILSACKPSQTAWVIFYFYIPAYMGGIVLAAAFRALRAKDE